jgi:hypothetical protein
MIATRILAIIVFALLSARAGAQAPSGRLQVSIETTDGSSAAGAIIALVDSRDNVIAEAIARSDGSRVLLAPFGSYRVRVLRIGFRPYVSAPVTLPNDTRIAIRLDAPRIVLASMLVKAATRCVRVDEEPESTGLVWTEVTKALRTSQLTMADISTISVYRTYRRKISPTGAVISADTIELPPGRARPFSAYDPAVLARSGYVRGDEYNGWQFFGPDEKVFLSSEFAATHCFRLTRKKDRPAEIGIAFEPEPGRKIPDIAGTAWVDQSSSELKEIVFRYVNAGVPSEFNASGFTHFRRMPSGSWIIDDWQLRMPQVGERRGPAADPRGFEKRPYYLEGYTEAGGGVVFTDRKN